MLLPSSSRTLKCLFALMSIRKSHLIQAQEFNTLAKDGEWMAAAHLPFPGIGHITAWQQGYSWNPVNYGPYQRAVNVPLLK